MNAFEKFLRSIPPGLNSRDVQLLSDRFKLITVSQGSHWLEAGEVPKQIAFVQKGCMRYYFKLEGGEKTVFFFTEKAMFSDYRALLKQEPSQVYIQALEDTELMVVNQHDLNELYNEYPTIERAGRMLIERLLISAETRLFVHITDSPEKRYLEILEKQPDLLQRVPQQHLASFLGVTPVSLSRIKSRIMERHRKTDSADGMD